MLNVWYANKLSLLVDRFLAVSQSALPPFPERAFHTTLVVVPNRNIESYLKFEIAQRAGIAANYEFCFLEDYFAKILSQTHSNKRLLHRGELRSLILQYLLDASPDELPKPVHRYIERGPTTDAMDRRRFELAGELARLFENYGFSRESMLQHWAKGEHLFNDQEPYCQTEEWQAAVWNAVLGPTGLLANSPREESVKQAILIHEFPDVMEPSSAPFRPAHLFGFSYIARLYREIMGQLAQNNQLDLYTFMPVDVEDPGASQDSGKTENLLARQWGKPGRENLALLRSHPCIQLKVLREPNTPANTNVLGTLQESIQSGTRFVGRSWPDDDDSLRVFACPSIEREVEIVGNHIWSLIDADDKNRQGKRRLKFHDIAVIVADRKRLGIYQAHFRSRFSSLHDLPFNLADVQVSRESPLLQGAVALIDLPFGEWTRAEMMHLLTHPSLLARFPQADPQLWKHWVEKLGVYIGSDRDFLADTYIEKDVFHWDQGLTRLALGAFLSGERNGCQEIFLQSGRSYVPVDFLSGETAAAGTFIAVARSLIGDARFARNTELSLADWALFFQHYFTTYLGAETEAEQQNLGLCLRQVYRLRDSDRSGRPVGYCIAAEMLREGLESLTGSRGHFLADGVVISSFLPMRPIPFRVAYVVGLGEGRFPARSDENALDLRRAKPEPGDVSNRGRDEYLFLETVMSTTEKLFLSYVSRDPHTGDTLQPSSSVDTLFYSLQRDLGIEDPAARLTIRFPLHRFDVAADQQSAAGVLATFDPEALAEQQARRLQEQRAGQLGERRRLAPAQLRQLPSKVREFLRVHGGKEQPENAENNADQPDQPPPTKQSPTKTEAAETVELPLSLIRRFLECPLQTWGMSMLGLREQEWRDGLTIRDEPTDFPPFQQAMLLREFFWTSTALELSELPQAYDKWMEFIELSGQTPTGLFLGTHRLNHLEMIRIWRDLLGQLSLPRLTDFHILRFGRAEEFADVDEILPAIRIPVRNELEESAKGVTVELYGKTEPLHVEAATSVTLICRSKVRDYDFLRGYVDYLALAAVGLQNSRPYGAAVLPSDPKLSAEKIVRRWPALTQEDAIAVLSRLLSDLLFTNHDYLMPADAVSEMFNDKKRRSLAEIVRGFKTGSRVSCRSLYGPVPKPLQYDAPPQELAERILDRRWRHFYESENS